MKLTASPLASAICEAKSSTRWWTSGVTVEPAKTRQNHWWHTVPGGLVTQVHSVKSSLVSGRPS